MAKKNTFGKFLAFSTAVAAIGGTCYIYRDKIKESSLYKKSANKFSNLLNKMRDKSAEDDDFYFDDDFDDDFSDDIFSDISKEDREYTSITINSKVKPTETSTENIHTNPINATPSTIDVTAFASDDTASSENVHEISSGNHSSDHTTTDMNTAAYESEGLSDASEDTDVLEEQDKLDF